MSGAAAPAWMRATIAAPLVLLAFIIAYGALGIGRDTTPKIHSLRNPAACIECHEPGDPAVPRTPEPQLCRRCHDVIGADCEPSDAAPTPACTACHDPHNKVANPQLLRAGKP